MKQVEPRVYLLAESHLVYGEVYDWLADLEGEAVLDHLSGTDPEQLVELAARRCYKSFAPGLNPNVTKVRTSSKSYHGNILFSRHGSVLSHATCTWAFEFVSRVFTHELVRNAVGNAFSQESLRYVRLTDLGFWLPDCIQKNPQARRLFQDTIETLEAAQQKLSNIFEIDQLKDFEQKKRLTSAFRRIAPLGLATGIVVTFNFRSLRWLLEQRSSIQAEEEMQCVIDQFCHKVVNRYPYVFQDFQPVEKQIDGCTITEWVPKYSKV